ncbi:MAG: hypothetical protein ACJ76H_02520 [Bacteriovoracaceae bacterium]
MRPGRELDTLIAQHIFGHEVIIKRKIPTEVTPAGERPLREYSKSAGAAFEVAEKMKISLIPIEGNQWFALCGPTEGFKSPADFMEFIGKGNFQNSGAAVAETAALAISLAAIKAVETRLAQEQQKNDDDNNSTTH